MFHKGKEAEGGQEQREAIENGKWRSATWDGIPGYAKYDPESETWQFSVELPGNTDPQSVVLGYASDSEADEGGLYTVSYRLKDEEVWRLVEVHKISEEGNEIDQSAFGAHTVKGFEREVGFSQIVRDVPQEL